MMYFTGWLVHALHTLHDPVVILIVFIVDQDHASSVMYTATLPPSPRSHTVVLDLIYRQLRRGLCLCVRDPANQQKQHSAKNTNCKCTVHSENYTSSTRHVVIHATQPLAQYRSRLCTPGPLFCGKLQRAELGISFGLSEINPRLYWLRSPLAAPGKSDRSPAFSKPRKKKLPFPWRAA